MEDDLGPGIEEPNDRGKLRKVVYMNDCALLLSQVKSDKQDIPEIGAWRAKVWPFGTPTVLSYWLDSHVQPVQQFFQDAL
jgi:hypothetical protein